MCFLLLLIQFLLTSIWHYTLFCFMFSCHFWCFPLLHYMYKEFFFVLLNFWKNIYYVPKLHLFLISPPCYVIFVEKWSQVTLKM
jgi:hypothetical protein